MYNIEKEISMTEANSGSKVRGKSKYGFHEMDVTDSIFFEGGKASCQCKPYAAMKAFERASGFKFSARKVGTGVRIWRTS